LQNPEKQQQKEQQKEQQKSNIDLLNDCSFSPIDSVKDQLTSFDCNDDDLNDFFKSDSHNYTEQLLGKTYCFVLESSNEIVCAFTLANDSIKASLLPNSRKKKVQKQIPHQKTMKSYPAVMIGRLGVDAKFQGCGIGKQLMNFIKGWFIDNENKTGCRFIVVDAYVNEKATAYSNPISF